MKRIKEIVLSLSLCLSLLVSLAPTASGLTDIQDHWAKPAIEEMVQKGAVSGYTDGTFKPENEISRAEFMSMINKSFGYGASYDINFRDVKPDDWYYNAVAIAVQAGYISGYEDNTMRPNNKITREEAAVIIKNILSLSNDEYATAIFTDHNACTWSKGSVGAVAKAGIINGYTDGTFQPKKNMSRAEASVILKATLGYGQNQNPQPITPPPTVNPPAITNPPTTNETVTNKDVTINSNQYGPSSGKEKINGDVTVTAASTTIQNTHITGNLTYDRNTNTSKLENVTVDGTIKVNGSTNITLKDSDIRNMDIRAQSGTPKVTAQQDTSIQNVYVYSNASLEESSLRTNAQGFKNVYLPTSADTNSKLTLSGNYANVEIAAKSNIQLNKGSIESLLFTADAEKTTMTIDSGTTIQSAVLRAKSSSILGNGTIKNADIRADDITLQKKPDKLTGNFTPNYKDGKNNTYTVEIKVNDSSNSKLSGAKVTLSGVSNSQNTNSNGVATFSNVKNGTYTVKVTKSGYADIEQTIKVNDKNYETTIKMNKGYSAEITVYESNGTTKISNASVTIDGKEVKTNSSGVAKFTDLSAKTYSFSAEKSGYQKNTGSITVKASSSTSTASVKLSATSGYTVNVTVKDTGGSKVSGAKVTLSGVSGSQNTNSNGVASFSNIKNGSYTVTVTKSGYADTTQSITVSSKQVDTNIQLAKGYQAQITVTESNGTTKVSGASVTLNGVTKPTNTQGVASFTDLQAKSYNYTVEKEGYTKNTGSITVKASTSPSTSTLKLTKVTTGKTLTLTVKDGNQTISGATVTLSPGNLKGTTDGNGVVKFENLAAKTYTVKVNKSPYNEFTKDFVISNANVTNTITLTKNYKITLILVEEGTENPIKNATVKINNQSAQTDNNGRYFTSLPPKNNYSYTVTANGYKSITDGKFNITNSDEERTVTMTPEIKYYTVKVTNTGDGIIDDSNISLVGNGTTFSPSKSGMVYTFSNVPAGNYDVVVKETSEHEGSSFSKSVSKDGSQTQSFDIQINKKIKTYDVKFTVNPAEASVTLTGVATKIASGGTATFNNVPEGSYGYTVSAEGYESETGTCSVPVSGSIPINLVAKEPDQDE